MKSFAEFLKEKEQEVRDAEAARLGELDHWVRSVDELYTQVESWLKVSDENHLLRFLKKESQIVETRVGAYTIDKLEIWFGGRVISLIPIARFIRGPLQTPGNGEWTGRVDLTDGENKFELFRFTHSDGSDGWFVRLAKYPMDELSKEIVEEFVMTLLS